MREPRCVLTVLERDVELGGDLVVGQPAGDRDQHLLLALGQR